MGESVTKGLFDVAGATILLFQFIFVVFGIFIVGQQNATANVEQKSSEAIAGSTANIAKAKNIFDLTKKFVGPSITTASY